MGDKSIRCLLPCAPLSRSFRTGNKRGSETWIINLIGAESLLMAMNSNRTLISMMHSIKSMTERRAGITACGIDYLTQEKTPLLRISSLRSPVISILAGVARKIPLEIF